MSVNAAVGRCVVADRGVAPLVGFGWCREPGAPQCSRGSAAIAGWIARRWPYWGAMSRIGHDTRRRVDLKMASRYREIWLSTKSLSRGRA